MRAVTAAIQPPKKLAPYDPRRALGRLAIALVVATLTTQPLSLRFGTMVQLLGGWDAGGLAMLLAAWTTIARADADKTRVRASAEDPGRRTVYFIVTFTSFVTLFAATFASRHLKSVADPGQS